MESEECMSPLSQADASTSRPSTRATFKDGSHVRWQSAKSPLLRQPRSTAASPSSPAMIITEVPNHARRRLSVFMRKQSIVPSALQLLQRQKDAVLAEPNAAQLSYNEGHNQSNPYRDTRNIVLKQFYLWNGIDMRKVNLPPLPAERKQKTNLCDAWIIESQAVRQLGNLTRNGPRSICNFNRAVERQLGGGSQEAPPGHHLNSQAFSRSETRATATQKILQTAREFL